MYMDTFPGYLEDSLQILNGIFPGVDGDVGVFADDFKLQVRSPAVMKGLPHILHGHQTKG